MPLQSPTSTVSAPNPVAAAVHFRAAQEAHRAHRLVEAEKACMQALAQDANHAEACHLLGILHCEQGNPVDGEGWLRRALSLRDDSQFHVDLGNVLNEMGRGQEGEACYRRALQLDSGTPVTHYNLAILCALTGRAAEAMSCYRRALCLAPDFIQAHDNLGILLHQEKRYVEAEKCYRRALAIGPDFAEAYVNLGKLKKENEQFDEAEQCYLQALRFSPAQPETHNNLGALYMDNKRLEQARIAYMRALILRPEYENAHINLAHVFHEMGKPELAEIGARRMLALCPDDADAQNGLGNCLHNLRKLEEAVAAFRHTMVLAPDSSYAYNNLANVLRELNRFDESDVLFQRALKMAENDFDTAINYSFLLLHRGDFERGWHYHEERLKHEHMHREPTSTSQAIFWNGDADLRGKTIVLYAEQGMGDTLQFARYVSLVAARGATVYLEVQGPLKSLMAGCAGVAGAFGIDESLPPFQYYAPLLSLPYIFKTRLDTIPAQVPYLYVNPARVRHWRNRLGPKNKLRVGLTWAGDPRIKMRAANALDRMRSLHFKQMLPLLDVPGIEFYSLQLGELTAHQLNGHPQVINVTSEIRDFEDTAAIVENLDLVITVDTSVCHLVGGLGKPVWMLNRHNTCWRWLHDRTDSPWYPTMRIFQQTEMADWEGVIAEVREALSQWSKR